jgi:CubicO group peptidase (beta-lactamase class C family)
MVFSKPHTRVLTIQKPPATFPQMHCTIVKMNHYRLVVVTLMLLLTALAARADDVDEYLKAQMEKNHIPGLAVAIVRDGRVIKLQGYGQANLEWDSLASPNTAFQLASSTKPITGTALMLLVQEGRIALDDKISKYLPDVPAAWQDITVRHLVTHSSGLKDDLGQHKIVTVEDAVKAASALPLSYKPGEKSAYGLIDYVVLTLIIEKVTGTRFQAFLRERIFQPLGMTASKFDNTTEDGPIRVSDLLKQRATIYNWAEGKQKNFAFLYPSWTYSAGGLYSSASDLSKWIVALDTGKLLSRTTLEQMWARQKLNDGKDNSFGIGWVIKTYRGRKTVGHSGGPALADILRFPDEELTIVVLTNQQRLFPRLAEGVADLFIPAPPFRETRGIEDNDEKLTFMLRGVLLDAAQGKVNADLFDQEAQKSLVPAFRDFGPVFFTSLDPLQSFVLVEQSAEGERRIRRYRALFGKKPIIWTFVLSKDGKIISMEPTSE